MTFLKDITWTEIFIFAHTCAALGCVLRVLYKQKNIGSTFAWLIILFLFPVFGTIAYLLIGEPRLGTARAKRTDEMNRFYQGFVETYLSNLYLDIGDKVKSRYHGISKVAASGTGLGATRNNAMTLLSTTDEIIDTILAARSSFSFGQPSAISDDDATTRPTSAPPAIPACSPSTSSNPKAG